MTLDFSAYPHSDTAIKARTQAFFELVGKVQITEAELLRLVQQGVCLEARDDKNNTALIWAGCFGYTETLQALLASGAHIEARNVHSDTPLIMAACYGESEALQALLAAGAHIEARNFHCDTPLIMAARNGRTETVQALLAAGANIEARDNDGETALLNAAANGHTKTMQALLAAGANIEARNNKGSTALLLAAWSGHTKTVTALLAAGANIEAQNGGGLTALTIATEQEIEQLVNPFAWHASYADFAAHGTPPKSAAEVYHWLAVTPLLDPHAPVDYVGNLQRIFAHAKWDGKEQAESILTQMQRDGRLNAETVDSILGNTLPERTHAERLKPRNAGIVR